MTEPANGPAPDGAPKDRAPLGAPGDLLRLDLQVCFALHATSRAFDTLYRRLLGDLGLTYPQYLAMLVLWEHGSSTVKELGRALRLDSGTLSPLLKRLETAGLVVRERSAHDERSVVVSLTGSGEAMRERAAEIPRHVLAATGLERQEVAALHDSLARITAALDEAAHGLEP